MIVHNELLNELGLARHVRQPTIVVFIIGVHVACFPLANDGVFSPLKTPGV
jgi:hypothetical protein